MTEGMGLNELHRVLSRKILIVCAATTLTAACGDPAGLGPPGREVPGPLFAAQSESGVGVIDGSGTFFVPCLGEALDVTSSHPFKYHRTVTPSGNVIFTDHFIQGASTGSAVGLTSGMRWTLRHVASPEVVRVTAGGSMAKFNANILWESEAGARLHLHSQFHFTQNSNGEVTIDRFEVRCTLH